MIAVPTPIGQVLASALLPRLTIAAGQVFRS